MNSAVKNRAEMIAKAHPDIEIIIRCDDSSASKHIITTCIFFGQIDLVADESIIPKQPELEAFKNFPAHRAGY